MNLKNIDIFVVGGGKCGSTTLYETFNNVGYSTIKCHNQQDFKNQFSYDGLFKSIQDSSLNKKIYIIDSYRTPIERKISSFFQHITKSNKNYAEENIFDLIDYFNKNKLKTIEEYHGILDIFDYFKISYFNKNNLVDNKYYYKEVNNFIFKKLLFKNISNWGDILSIIFNKEIKIIKSNITENKNNVKEIYKKFKENYVAPPLYINELKNDEQFNFFLDETEKQEYFKNHFYDKYKLSKLYNNKIIVIFNDINFRSDWDVVWFNKFIKEIYKIFNVIYINPNNYDDDYFIKKYKKIPDYIIGYEIFLFPKNKSKKILITEDLHLRSLKVYDDLFEKIDIILPRFNIINNLFNNKFKSKIIEFPLYCNDIFLVKKINLNSENKIIMYGNINGDQYWLRKKWCQFFKKNFSNIFKYVEDTTEKTSQIIRNYSYGLVSGYTPIQFQNINEDKNGYVVCKFFEILGSGLLLLADTTDLKEELQKYGFRDNINYIDITFENIHEKIKFITDPINKDKINIIRLNRYNLIKDKHLLIHRMYKLKNILS